MRVGRGGLTAARNLFACVFLLATLRMAVAGAWLMPPGAGQIIAGTAFSGSTRAFDAQGRLVPVPSYQKFELGAYIEYGLTDWATLVATPSHDRISQPAPAISYSGIGQSGLGARFGLYRSDELVFSAQALLASPGASFNGNLQPHRAASLDLRALAGYNFALGSMSAFLDAETAYRFYAQEQPGEWKFDVSFGVRPIANLLVLIQSFGSLQQGEAQGFPQSWWEKLQGSFVYDFNSAWSAQLGVFMTIAGKNTGRELGPVGAIWYKF
ncbi:conserved hypothetical protein [Methylocella silvestris BL2]|uniref:Uncharacterized protein n=1 Tax=Methylocella silvestris (strain DSM 15510 / CIP 108128 / LMG 27833 / NCIMB 13906 / BL2) TaxID=395965 RepID=B8EP63_METSB|nr:hypothetical protein [Methylocella silvestris]ACK49651.1 conserved hypothetical protein [Methylocella silvestris BL2]